VTETQTLTAERWRRFGTDQQILMIANEMQRGLHSMKSEQRPSLQLVYERVLHMLGLTVQGQLSRSERREILRWKEVVGQLYLAEKPDPTQHREALRFLLRLRPALAAQVEPLGL
jgi:hypothetical protein